VFQMAEKGKARELVRDWFTRSAEDEWRRLKKDPYHRLEFLVTMHFLEKHLPEEGAILDTSRFIPVPQMGSEPIYIEPAEVEALRLVDFEGLSQEEAGERPGVFRGTVWRLLESGRKKTVEALVKARPLTISSQPPPKSLQQTRE